MIPIEKRTRMRAPISRLRFTMPSSALFAGIILVACHSKQFDRLAAQCVTSAGGQTQACNCVASWADDSFSEVGIEFLAASLSSGQWTANSESAELTMAEYIRITSSWNGAVQRCGLQTDLGRDPAQQSAAAAPAAPQGAGSEAELARALIDAVVAGDVAAATKSLLAGADPDSRIDGHAPVLFVAAQEGHLEVVRTLLKYKASVDLALSSGATPLGIAAQNGHAGIVRELLEHGAQVDPLSGEGVSPLLLAAQYDQVEAAELLLAAGAKVDIRREGGQTALGMASLKGFTRMVALLLEHGANVSNQSDDGTTPLHQSAREGHLAICRLLADNGAKVDAADIRHRTPLQLAVFGQHRPVVEYLLAAGADPNIAADGGVTAMHVAAGGGALEIARLLLPQSDLSRKDDSGYTAEDIADKRNDAALRLLLQNAAIERARGDSAQALEVALLGHEWVMVPAGTEVDLGDGEKGAIRRDLANLSLMVRMTNRSSQTIDIRPPLVLLDQSLNKLDDVEPDLEFRTPQALSIAPGESKTLRLVANAGRIEVSGATRLTIKSERHGWTIQVPVPATDVRAARP